MLYRYILFENSTANLAEFATLKAGYPEIEQQVRERVVFRSSDCQVDENGDYIRDGNGKILLIEGRLARTLVKVTASDFDALEQNLDFDSFNYTKLTAPEVAAMFVVQTIIDPYHNDIQV
jgi:hypothetical protein